MNVDLKKKFIKGSNTIYFDIVNDFDSLQIDLFAKMKIEKIIFNNTELRFRRRFDAVFVRFPETQRKGTNEKITVFYSGNPQIAKAPPWSGGFVWKKDRKDAIG
jgi:hypothetical protein